MGPAAASFPAPAPPIQVEAGLSPDIVSTQLEHLLEVQQRLQARTLVNGEDPAVQALEHEVAGLVDHLCKHHLTELGSPWNVVR